MGTVPSITAVAALSLATVDNRVRLIERMAMDAVCLSAIPFGKRVARAIFRHAIALVLGLRSQE
jgi:hypothetical protein